MGAGALIVASLEVNIDNPGSEEIVPFLPMLSIGGTTMIKREISILRKAGIAPIMVLCGYQKELLKNHLSHNHVLFCEDSDFAEHSWEETQEIGLSFASQLCDRVLLIPVETPAFSVDTIQKMAECTRDTVPVFQGTEGRQRYICFPQDKEKASNDLLEVEDEGILYSLDKENDFFGPGTYALLCAIERTGSIQAASAELGMSYSKSWKLVNKVEQELGFPFLKRCNGGRNGGNSTLTEEGKGFLKRYHALVEDVSVMLRNYFHVYFQDFQ